MALTNKQKVGTGSGVIAAILAAVLAVEGGYVNNPKDPGGATNHGITEKVARANGYTGDMKVLPKQTAIDIYDKQYVKDPGFTPFAELSPAVLEELVDSGVNTGPARPSRWLQLSLNALNRDGKDYPDIAVDGKVGNGTVNAYKALVKIRGKVKACELTIKLLDGQQAAYYMSLGKLETFTPGWIDHRIGNVPLNRC